MYDLQKLSFGLLGMSVILLGATLPYYWSNFLMCLVNRELTLSPDSKTFNLWKGTPVPITMDFYFLNWTNPHELLNGSKPAFVEMGPYRFNEVHEKINISWNDNDTVTFQMVRRWYFDEKNSNGSLDDKVTTLNVVALTAAHTVRYWSFVMKTSLSLTLTGTKQNITVTKRVREFLFEGFTDKLIDIARSLPQFSGVDIPFDRFGWFYKMNGSTLMDGVFTMNTGKANIQDLGRLDAWNYKSETKYFDGACAAVKGYAGELFPPKVNKDVGLTMFSANLCRSITFGYTDEHVVLGISGHRFTGGSEMIDNGTMYPENHCYCGGECLPSGVINVTSCRYGAPAFASFPHFHLADPYFREAIEGMKPDPEKHTFYITLEPRTGIPLDVGARLQINVFLRPVPQVSLYSKVPSVMVPIIWFEQRATLTPELAAPLQFFLFMFGIDMYISFTMVIIGMLLITYVVVTASHIKKDRTALDFVNSLDELTALRSGKTVNIVKT